MDPTLSYNQILDHIRQLDGAAYARTRNHLNGAVSKISPYLTRGVVSLPAVRDTVLENNSPEAARKFLQELAWREYFQKVFAARQTDIFSDLRFSRDDWRHDQLVSSVVEASTGITTIDQQITELYETGYLHNHGRMWVAMLACNVAKANWQNMSRWLYYHLIDGDLASNTLSWQWVAGTSVNKRYVANQSLINDLSEPTQEDTYLSVEREQVEHIELPTALKESQAFSYTMNYPDSDDVSDVSNDTVFLYHPWSIDPQWRKDESGKRIFIIEPKWFDRFPVSPKVLEHMLSLLKTHVPHASIFVGNVEELPGIDTATVHSKYHPATTYFPGTIDASEELYPEVQGYHQSFTKFWQACQKAH